MYGFLEIMLGNITYSQALCLEENQHLAGRGVQMQTSKKDYTPPYIYLLNYIF